MQQQLLVLSKYLQAMIQHILNYKQHDQDYPLNLFLGNTNSTSINQPESQLIDFFSNDHFSQYRNKSPPQTQQPIDILNDLNHLSSSFIIQPSQHQNSYYQHSSSPQPNLYTQQLQNHLNRPPLPSKKEKNSNTIKKIGRIILDNLREYKNFYKSNTAVSNMLKTLSKSSKVGRTEMNKRDKFNTYHLRLLVNGRDEELVSHNLRTTRRVLSKCLRDNVLSSKQISNQNKLLYLNTMKCSALRCINKNLAVRLQMSMRD